MAPVVTRRDALVPVLLAAASAIMNYPLALQGRVLASFDTLVYFYPNASYLAERVRAGQVPLWDPYLFAGVPFLANSQVGAMYPPNWLYAIGPVSEIYSILFVGHVWLFALGIYLLARLSLGLSREGSLYAAFAVALSGFVGGMSGHLNQVEALAWAPLAVLCVERAVVRSRLRMALLGTAPLALCAYAGHSQVLYMTGILVLAAALSRAAQKSGLPRFRRSLSFASTPSSRQRNEAETCDPPTWPAKWGAMVRMVGIVAVAPVLAAFLASAQLLPTFELAGQSIRATGLSFADAGAFSFPPTIALVGLLPTVNQPPPSTEWLGYVGLGALLFAGWGILRHRTPEAVWLAALAVVGLLLAFGQLTPVYRLAFDLVPGFRLFRVPARWLTFWTIGAGLLAGYGLDQLLVDAAGWSHLAARRLGWRKIVRWNIRRIRPFVARSWLPIAMGLSVLIVAAAVAHRYRQLIVWPSLATVALWIASLLGVALVAQLARSRPRLGFVVALALLSCELFVSSFGLPQQQAVWPDAVETRRATVDHLVAQNSSERVLALGDNSYDPGDLADIRRRLGESLPADAREAYVTGIKHVEGLTPNLSLRYDLRTIDGYDGGILPLARFDWLKKLFLQQGPDVSDGRLRIQLKSAPDPRLLGWLDVRYLMMDRLRDRWIDGVYFDLGISQPLEPGAAIDLPSPRSFEATAIGIALRGSGNNLPSGTLAVEAGGQSAKLDTSGPPGTLIGVDKDVDPNGVRLWKLILSQPAVIDGVHLTWRGDAAVIVRSVSLIDERTGASQTVPASPLYHLSLLGDMKIYENTAVLPRAFLADGLIVRPDLSTVVDSLRQPGWNATRVAVASAQEVESALAFEGTGGPGDVDIIQDQPERLVASTSSTVQKVLVLTDSVYPGWQATLDGRDTPILTVNVLFRGVVVPPGRHEVSFTYAPRSWSLGVVVTLITALAVVIALVWPTRRPGGLDGS